MRQTGIAEPKPVPRKISADQRAPEGLKRYKAFGDVAAMGGRLETVYLLAENEQQAHDCYADLSGMKRHFADRGESIPAWMIVVSELPD